jgi:hypothetical protein
MIGVVRKKGDPEARAEILRDLLRGLKVMVRMRDSMLRLG